MFWEISQLKEEVQDLKPREIIDAKDGRGIRRSDKQATNSGCQHASAFCAL